MDYMTDLISNGVTSYFLNMANDFLALGFEVLTNFLIDFSDVNKYVDINIFLVYSQAIACALLSVNVAWSAFKTQSGGVFKGGNSFSVLGIKTVFAGASIYLLPHLVMKVLIPINNLTVNVITLVGKEYKISADNMFQLIQKIGSQAMTLVMGVLVLSIAVIILSIMSAIRYIDLILCIIISPFVALSIIGDGEGLSTWARETFAIVFTQSIHILLLQIFMKILVSTEGLTMLILAIGNIVVMIKGGNVLRTYTHKTGVSGGITSLSSMAIMKTNMTKLKSSMV